MKSGIINLLKPAGMTSHDVIYFLKKHKGVKKAGHTGTLDPDAAGVLPVCVGKATRLFDALVAHNKTYKTVMQLGQQTNTHDAAGRLLGPSMPIPEKQRVIEVLQQFVGKQKQTPPLYSAVKIKGQKAYEYARRGEQAVLPAKDIEVFDIRVCHANDSKGEYILEIDCSKGTYIRSLVHKVGQALGCGAYVSFLLRVKSGPFDIAQSHTLEELSQQPLKDLLLPMDMPFMHLPAVYLDGMFKRFMDNGSPVGLNHLLPEQQGCFKNGQRVRLYCAQRFCGIAEEKNGQIAFCYFVWDREEA